MSGMTAQRHLHQLLWGARCGWNTTIGTRDGCVWGGGGLQAEQAESPEMQRYYQSTCACTPNNGDESEARKLMRGPTERKGCQYGHVGRAMPPAGRAH